MFFLYTVIEFTMRGRGKNLNSRLAESEIIYQSVFNHSFDGILLTSPDGRILAANPAACRMFGRSEEELCRLGRTGVMNINDPRLVHALEKREITGEFAGEMTGLRKDGTVFPVELTTSVFTDSTGVKRTSMIIRDISFRKKYMEELEAREANMQSILENTDNSILLIDKEFRFLTGNLVFQDKFQSRTGIRIRQGDDVTEWMQEDSREKWRGYFTKGISGINFTTMSATGTGLNRKYMRDSFNPVRNRAGEVTGLTITGIDVTDLMLMQKDLVKTGVMLKEAQAVAKLGNWAYDTRSGRAKWSDELFRIFGLPRRAGEPSWKSHLERIHPDDVKMFGDEVIKAYSEGIPFNTTLRLQIPGEGLKWINTICKADKDHQGNVTRLYGTVQDVTVQERADRELARSEERYRNLFENSVVPIMEEDFSEVKKYFDKLLKRGVKDFRKYFTRYPERAAQCVSMVKITDANQTSIRYFGVKEKSDLMTDLDSFFTEESYGIFLEEIIELAEGSREFDSDMPLRLLSGEERFVHLRLHVIPDEADTLLQVLVTWIDITDRIRYVEGLRKSGETLRQFNMHIEEAREKERSEIAMNLHDDLGQKLTVLKMNLSWLQKRIGVQSELVSEKFNEIDSIIETSIGTVQKISSDLRPAILYELGLKEAIEWHMKHTLAPAGIKGSFSIIPDTLTIHEKSSIVLFRIIQEALTNIIRHSGAGRADVRIARLPSFIELVIRDNGRGIDDETVNDPKSFGITSIKERVRNISGDFTITGKKGKGTILRVRIPLTKIQSANDQGNNNR